jgi:hypothetical protein
MIGTIEPGPERSSEIQDLLGCANALADWGARALIWAQQLELLARDQRQRAELASKLAEASRQTATLASRLEDLCGQLPPSAQQGEGEQP